MADDSASQAVPHVVMRQVRKGFERDGQRVDVLQGVDLTIERGDAISIVGRSGAGKSTLLHILGTLDRPSSGEVLWNGRNVLAEPEASIAKFRGHEVGFIFQFHHLLPEFTSLENAAMPALIARVPKDEAYERAKKILDRVGLSHRLTHRPSELSGGEQQRVALARALVMQPSLLLADEPTGNLDEAIGQEIFELFQEVNREMNVSIVVVTHHPGLAASMRRQLVVDAGVLRDVRDDANLNAGVVR